MLKYASNIADQYARIVAYLSDGNSIVGLPVCGLYPVLRENEDPTGNYAVILAGVADLLAQYRSGLSG